MSETLGQRDEYPTVNLTVVEAAPVKSDDLNPDLADISPIASEVDSHIHRWDPIKFDISPVVVSLFGTDKLPPGPRSQYISLMRAVSDGVASLPDSVAGHLKDHRLAISQAEDYQRLTLNKVRTVGDNKIKLAKLVNLDQIAENRWIQLAHERHPIVQVYEVLLAENNTRASKNMQQRALQVNVLRESRLQELALGMLLGFDLPFIQEAVNVAYEQLRKPLPDQTIPAELPKLL